jgi:hypothetical protein
MTIAALRHVIVILFSHLLLHCSIDFAAQQFRYVGVWRGSGSSGSTGVKTMKRLSVIFLSTAAICAFASATPALAQEPIMDPEGPAPIAAEPPHTPRRATGSGYDNGPFAALGAIFAARAITGNSADTQPKGRCQVIRDFNDAHARPTTFCD